MMEFHEDNMQGQEAPEFQNYTAPEQPQGEAPNAEDLIKWDEYQRKLRRARFLRFPYPVLVVLLFLMVGFTFGWWHPGWMLFLTIPLYYGMASGI